MEFDLQRTGYTDVASICYTLDLLCYCLSGVFLLSYDLFMHSDTAIPAEGETNRKSFTGFYKSAERLNYLMCFVACSICLNTHFRELSFFSLHVLPQGRRSFVFHNHKGYAQYKFTLACMKQAHPIIKKFTDVACGQTEDFLLSVKPSK